MQRPRHALRVGGWSLVVSAVAGGLALCYPGGLAVLYSDVTNYQRNTDKLADSRQTLRRLEAATINANDRLRLKQELRDQLAQGTVPLAGAADAYLHAVLAEPHLLPRYRAAMPVANDEELMAVNLIREVFAVIPISDDRRQSLLEQFRTAYGTDYPLPLPTAPALARTSAASDPATRP